MYEDISILRLKLVLALYRVAKTDEEIEAVVAFHDHGTRNEVLARLVDDAGYDVRRHYLGYLDRTEVAE